MGPWAQNRRTEGGTPWARGLKNRGGAILGVFGLVLTVSGGPWGPVEGVLWAYWRRLGGILGLLGASWGRLGAS